MPAEVEEVDAGPKQESVALGRRRKLGEERVRPRPVAPRLFDVAPRRVPGGAPVPARGLERLARLLEVVRQERRPLIEARRIDLLPRARPPPAGAPAPLAQL